MASERNYGATISNTLLAVYFFLNGIDFALILPSINFYLQNVGAEPGFMGKCVFTVDPIKRISKVLSCLHTLLRVLSLLQFWAK